MSSILFGGFMFYYNVLKRKTTFLESFMSKFNVLKTKN